MKTKSLSFIVCLVTILSGTLLSQRLSFNSTLTFSENTTDNQLEDLTHLIVNPGFDQGTAGWNVNAPGSKISVAEKAGGLIAGNQNHLQFWVGSGGVTGTLSQTITNVQTGRYILKAAISPTFSGQVTLYLNDNETTVSSGKAEIYEVNAYVLNNNIEIGISMNTSGSPTIDIDEFQLYYAGVDDADLLPLLNEKVLQAAQDTIAMLNTNAKPAYNNIIQYREVLSNVADRANDDRSTLLNLIEALDEVINDYKDIITQYSKLDDKIKELEAKLKSSAYVDKANIEIFIAEAKLVYNTPADQRDTLPALITSIDEKVEHLTQYYELKKLIVSSNATIYNTDFPGKEDYLIAVNQAKDIVNYPSDKNIKQALFDLKQAYTIYYESQYNLPAFKKTISWVDTSLDGSEKFVLRVDGKPFYMTNIQVRLDKLYGYEGWNDAELEAVVKRAADDNFNTISTQIHWKEIEPEKDLFDWTILDKYLNWCKKYDIKVELLWFSWSSGGRVQYLWNYNGKREVRTPDYVCSLDGTSEFNMLRKEWEYSLDWRDEKLRDREKYVLRKMMDHIALWNANNGNPNTVIGIQLGNEARPHGDNTASDAEIINYYHHVGGAVKESKYVTWTRLNCVSWETPGRINANEAKRNSGGTNIDFVGIDIYGTSASSIVGNMNGQMPQVGKNYSMIMEIDAKDANSPLYQMAALAGNKAFDYYNMGFVDGNGLYTNSGKKLVERDHIDLVRQRNKILGLANEDIALKASGGSLYVYNYAGNSMATESGLAGIKFTPDKFKTQAIAVRRNNNELVLMSTLSGTFTIPESLGFRFASKGYFNEKNQWVHEEDIVFDGKTIVMPVTSAVLLRKQVDFSGIHQNELQEGLNLFSKDGALVIQADEKNKVSSVTIYSSIGQLVRTVDLIENPMTVELPRGIYIANNQKIVIK